MTENSHARASLVSSTASTSAVGWETRGLVSEGKGRGQMFMGERNILLSLLLGLLWHLHRLLIQKPESKDEEGTTN